MVIVYTTKNEAEENKTILFETKIPRNVVRDLVYDMKNISDYAEITIGERMFTFNFSTESFIEEI